MKLHIVDRRFGVLSQRRDRFWERADSIVDIAIAEPMIISMARNLALPQADVVEGGVKASSVPAVVLSAAAPRKIPRPLFIPQSKPSVLPVR